MRVKVKLFGLLRIDSGIKEVELEASTVRELYPLLLAEMLRRDPECSLDEKDLRACVVAVNEQRAKPGTKLSPGDVVCLLPPVAGG